MKTPATSRRTDGTPRPILHDVFFAVAEAVAARSTCPDGARHGAVLVREARVLSTGYGSPPAGVPPCSECWLRTRRLPDGEKDWAVCPSVHAELNALLQAARHGVPALGAVLYVTKTPCPSCLRAMKNAGVAGYYVRLPGNPLAKWTDMEAADALLRSPCEPA